MRYYEDLVEGEEATSGTRTLTEKELLEFARQYDPQYFHCDPDAARRSIFGGIVASGIYTMALWRQLDHQIAHDIAWICGVAWDDVRFPVAVRAGDTLRARAKCLSKRPSGGRPERGVVVYQYILLNQRDETVFSCRSTNLVERRQASP
ncbi:MAG TPA: MaoC family dehydratase [Steroidobacteraceae bacterium]|nr:MaoC family dehydratase [Steroidobacteraceae bacterium]